MFDRVLYTLLKISEEFPGENCRGKSTLEARQRKFNKKAKKVQGLQDSKKQRGCSRYFGGLQHYVEWIAMELFFALLKYLYCSSLTGLYGYF